jgi:hypothetical protein
MDPEDGGSKLDFDFLVQLFPNFFSVEKPIK